MNNMTRRQYELGITCIAIFISLLIDARGTVLVVSIMLAICVPLMLACILLEYTNEPKGKRNMKAAVKKTIHGFLYEA